MSATIRNGIILTATGVLLAGALGLAWINGPALILDLANGTAAFFCL